MRTPFCVYLSSMKIKPELRREAAFDLSIDVSGFSTLQHDVRWTLRMGLIFEFPGNSDLDGSNSVICSTVVT